MARYNESTQNTHGGSLLIEPGLPLVLEIVVPAIQPALDNS